MKMYKQQGWQYVTSGAEGEFSNCVYGFYVMEY